MEKRSLRSASSRPVAIWVSIGVVMLLVQVILGGITRLTGSGLSITEWDFFTGTLPPLSQQQWLNEYHKYTQTPQFHLLNPDFSLHDFKFIFFWEWFHRFWARLVGIVFIIGFVYLAIKRRFRPEMIRPLLILFIMGGLQGAIGWVMVKSGLTGDAIYVQPTKLALHFIFAMGLIACTMWFALQLLVPTGEILTNTSLHRLTATIILLLFFQLLFGALMAGYKAASVASTWPTINGDWIPQNLFKDSPTLLNFINNKITIQFVHRGLAYLISIFVLIWSIKISAVTQSPGLLRRTRYFPILAVFIQILLGICTVLTSTQIVAGHWGMFESIALIHQLTGMLFFLLMICMLYLLRPERR